MTTLGLVLALGLSGCGGGDTVGEAVGFDQKGPDEMTVIKRPPLIVPPDFNLRPPRAGEPRSNAGAASKAARETLVGPSAEPATGQPDNPGLAPVNGASLPNDTSAAARAEATLIGQPAAASDDPDAQRYHKSPPSLSKEEQAAKVDVEGEPSAGQSALLSRTDRVERDLDALDERRDESRVDGALLRRLLAWKQAPDSAAEGLDGDEPTKTAVRIVRREQTPVSSSTSLE